MGESAEDVQTPQGTVDPPTEKKDSNGKAEDAPQSADTDWREMARKWERRAKADAAKLAQMEQRVKTLVEPETVADKDRALADAQAEARTARHDALRYRIAAEEGLAPTMALRLLGDDEDALRADAKDMAKALTPQTPKRTDGARGTSDGGKPPTQTDPNALLRQMLGSG